MQVLIVYTLELSLSLSSHLLLGTHLGPDFRLPGLGVSLLHKVSMPIIRQCSYLAHILYYCIEIWKFKVKS